MAAEASNQAANAKFQASDYAAALNLYSEAVGKEPQNPKYLGNRAQCYLTMGKYAKAAADADKAIERGGTTAKVYYRAAKAYYEGGDLKQSKARLMPLLEQEPENGDGKNLLKAIQDEEAAAAAQSRSIDPNSPEGGRRYLATIDEDTRYYKLPTSGLRFRVLASSEKAPDAARSPNANDECTVHYHGTLVDGTVFDSSVRKNRPSHFAPSQVIKGWTEALQLMREGDKWEVVLPSEIAYGKRGAGGAIPPNSTLIFTIELLQVGGSGGKPAAEASAALQKLIGKSHEELTVTS